MPTFLLCAARLSTCRACLRRTQYSMSSVWCRCTVLVDLHVDKTRHSMPT